MESRGQQERRQQIIIGVGFVGLQQEESLLLFQILEQEIE
jgi:hypothetical protein